MTGLSNQQGYNLYPRRSVDMEYIVITAGVFTGVLIYHILADIYKRCKKRKAEKEMRRKAWSEHLMNKRRCHKVEKFAEAPSKTVSCSR